MPVLSGFLDVPTYGILFGDWHGKILVNPDAVDPSIFPWNIGGFGWAYSYVESENGSTIYITDGDYRPSIRVLRYSGNDSDPNDYQSWLGPIIRAEL
jgi:hypothetical protein